MSLTFNLFTSLGFPRFDVLLFYGILVLM